MDVFLLGAGRPARGDKPAALKRIAKDTRVMDWQLHSFGAIDERIQFNYLGGYQVDEVIQAYPELNFTVIADWEKRSVLHTLLHAPFSNDSVVITYSDTVFRQETISALVRHPADVVFGIDSCWQQRYSSRSQEDIQIAEKVRIEQFDENNQGEAEFTGLIHLKPSVVSFLANVDDTIVGTSLLDLLFYLKSSGFKTAIQDVAGHWAEFNEPEDIAHFILGTKADTLGRLKPLVHQSIIGEQVSFTVKEWISHSPIIVNLIRDKFDGSRLIIRSSAKGEDNWLSSNAGGFESLLNIKGHDSQEIENSIDQVIQSYGGSSSEADQVLVQVFLQNVRCAGVVFSCGLETGSPYYRFNFDDRSQSTESVTAGTQAELRTIIANRYHADSLSVVEPKLLPVLRAVQELQKLLGFDKLDIEFAIDENGRVHIFQVRPVSVDHSIYETDDNLLLSSLDESVQRFLAEQKPLPFEQGDTTAFGNMPDWNPAEIIGTHPKPLAFSLYRLLITNEVWAKQRAQFGYRDVRPHPLIVAFSGQPYVDIRASFNSFIPTALDDELAAKLVNVYLKTLADHPERHDKVEFDIAFTIWTPSFKKEASERLLPYGLTTTEISTLEEALKQITRDALLRLHSDIEPIQTLMQRCEQIEKSDLKPVDRLFALLDDCRRFGTLAFSHAARAGFVATALLKSFVSSGIISQSRCDEFMQSLQTIAKEFESDKVLFSTGGLSREQLINAYGHLRQGTYEITAQAYWEDPECYLTNVNPVEKVQHSDFELTDAESREMQRGLAEMGSLITTQDLLVYLKQAIEAREKVKFNFTRSLSKALDACADLGKELSLTRDQMSFLEYHDLEETKLNTIGLEVLKSRIAQNKKNFLITQLVELPTLILKETDFYCFERHASQANFVTTGKIESSVQLLDGVKTTLLKGSIVLIPQADPGYDWLFGHGISGLITKYGGANSHMAIRAAEIGLPAAIGVGEKVYERLSKMHKLELDCANQVIREVQ